MDEDNLHKIRCKDAHADAYTSKMEP